MLPPRTHEQLAAAADGIHVAFCEAVPARRWALLEEACAGDPALRAAVEMRLVGAHTTADMEGHAGVAGATDEDGEFRIGALVAGRYRMQQRIGEGGLGVVYLAQQEAPVRRKVAIKVLHAGLESRTAIGRFEAEIGALSRMNHPHVAAIYDAGRTPGGRMYVVMEFIDGEPIDMFCFNQSLPVTEMLRLFVKVCRAVQHAHQRGVIHRDLKPLNILVKNDDGPSPRIIDFGIARSVLGDGSLGPRLTVAGVHVGTPEYMSPEQAGLVDAEPDTSSDVYSLGVMLYELISGRLPVDFEGRREPIYWRKVLADATIVPPSVAAKRGRTGRHEPQPAARIPRDLDAITMTAIAREPAKRYASAAEMASDIERFLDGRPVLARRPGLGYVLTRAIARRPGVAIATAVVVCLALAGLWIAASLTAQVDRQRRQSEDALVAAKAERLVAEKAAESVERMSARSSLIAAVTALHLFDVPAVLENLDDMPLSQRGWGERFLRGQATRWEGRYELGKGRIAALAIPDSGDLIFIGGDDGVLRAFSTETQAIEWELALGPLSLQDLAVSRDGKWVATSDRETRVVLVDTAGPRVAWSRAARARLTLSAFEVAAASAPALLVTLAPAKSLGAPGAPWRPVILDVISGAEREVLDIALPVEGEAHFCADEGAQRLIVSLGGGSAAYSRQGRLIWKGPAIVQSLPRRGCGVAIFADAEADGPLLTRALLDGVVTGTIRRPESGNLMAVIGPGGLTATQEGVAGVVLRDDGSGVAPVRVAAGRAAIRALAFEPSGAFLWSGDAEGILTRWRADLAPNPTVVDAGFAKNAAGAVAADGNLQVATGWGFVRATDGLRHRPRWSRWLGRQYITSVSVSPAGDHVVVGDWSGRLTVLAASDGRILAETKVVDDAIAAVHDNGDGLIIVGTVNGRLLGARFAEVDGRGQLKVLWSTDFEPGFPVTSIAPMAKSPLFAAALGHVNRLPAGGRPAGRGLPLVTAALPATGVALFDLRTGRLALRLENAGTTWRSLAASPAGDELFASAEDGTLHRWDLATGRLTGRRPGVGGSVVGIGFGGRWGEVTASSGEREARLLVALDTGNIAVWDARTLDYLFLWPLGSERPLAIGVAPDESFIGFVSQTVSAGILRVNDLRDDGTFHRDLAIATVASRALRDKVDPERAAQAIEAGEYSPADYRGRVEGGTRLRAEAAAWARAWARNPNQLNSLAWAAVRQRESFEALDVVGKRRVLAMAETAVSAGNRAEFVNTLALVKLRLGDFEGALHLIRLAESTSVAIGGAVLVADRCIAVMALAQLGRPAEARALLKKTLAHIPPDVERNAGDMAALIHEAVAMTAP